MVGASTLPPPAETSIPSLANAVQQLAQNVRVLTDLVEATREELQWIARNGVPHQALTVRLVPAAVGAQDKFVARVEAVEGEGPLRDQPVTTRELEQACEWLGEHITELLQEQLNLFVGAVQSDRRSAAAASPRGTTREAEGSSPSPPMPIATDVVPKPVPLPHRPSSLLFPEEPVSGTTDARDERQAEVASVASRPLERPVGLPPVTLWDAGEAVAFRIDGREVWGEIVLIDEADNTARVELIPSGEEVTVSLDELRMEEGTLRCGCIDPLSQRGDNVPNGQRPMSAEAPVLPPPSAPVSTDESDFAVEETLDALRAMGNFPLARFASVRERLQQGTITAEELRLALKWLIVDRDEFCALLIKRLKHGQLRSLAATLGCPTGDRQTTKVTLARDCFHSMLRAFALDAQIPWHLAQETYEEAAITLVSRLTDDDLCAYAARTDHVPRRVGEFVALLQAKRR